MKFYKPHERCLSCVNFMHDHKTLENIFPTVLLLSSMQGSTRGKQGFCKVHDRFLNSNAVCEDFKEVRD